ncbi:hypothetical protein MHYP_G00072800 [Metynnis hypsauchen]
MQQSDGEGSEQACALPRHVKSSLEEKRRKGSVIASDKTPPPPPPPPPPLRYLYLCNLSQAMWLVMLVLQVGGQGAAVWQRGSTRMPSASTSGRGLPLQLPLLIQMSFAYSPRIKGRSR